MIAHLPKIELHCHLDGILHPSMARAIRQSYPDFPIDPDELAKAYPINGLESFFGWWEYIRSLDRNLDQYQPVVQYYIEQLKSEHVRYAEIMIANGEIPNDAAAAVDKVSEFRAWVNHCEDGALQVEFLVAIGRSQTAERMRSFEDKILALFEAGLVHGIALAGPEIDNPVKPFTRSFARFHEAGMGIEMHAGEWVGVESVYDALEYGYPDRIGHGVALFSDPRLVDLFVERQIHIEMCPTSNLLTGSIGSLEDHPIHKALALGMNFSINTDDPGIFMCSMRSEMDLITRLFGFSEEDWMTIYRNSLAARFQKTLRLPDLQS